VPPPKVFISHTTQDPRDFARAHEIADGLRELGAEVWIAPDNIPAGAEWEQKLVSELLDTCACLLVLLTPASAQSEWVQREVQLAETRYAQANGAFTILPIVVGQLPDGPAVAFLRRFQAIPWREDCGEQVYLVARALGISAAPAPLTDRARAVQFLEREKRREEETVRPLRRVRALAPIVGLAAYAPVALLMPDAKALAAAVLAAGPVVSGALGWGVTTGRIQQSDTRCRWLDTMKDGLDLCAAATGPACKRLWEEFWKYAEQSTTLPPRNEATR
jgi:hypothetical protein